MNIENAPLFSVILCTRNRAWLLDRALDSLAQQSIEGAKFEVVVVDNGSTDNTVEVIRTWEPRFSCLRYVHEANVGLSFARNRGAQVAQAELLVYLDDDARASTGWLKALEGTYRSPLNYAAAGGPIYLDWEGSQPPRWMTTSFMQCLGFLDYGSKPQAAHHVNGGNMVVRKSVLVEYGGFKTGLGRKGNKLLGGEESDLMYWLRRNGRNLYYEPNAVVFHFVPLSRQTVSYMIRLHYNLGITEALRRADDTFRYALYKTGHALIRATSRVRTEMAAGSAGPAVLVTFLCELSLMAGVIRGFASVIWGNHLPRS